MLILLLIFSYSSVNQILFFNWYLEAAFTESALGNYVCKFVSVKDFNHRH